MQLAIRQNPFYQVVCIQLNTKFNFKNVFSVAVQEEGARKVLVYLDIPELKVKRSFPNFLKFIPSNGDAKVLDFQNQ
jgi:hypothetical protein